MNEYKYHMNFSMEELEKLLSILSQVTDDTSAFTSMKEKVVSTHEFSQREVLPEYPWPSPRAPAE